MNITTGLCLRTDTPGQVGPVTALPPSSTWPSGDVALFIHGFNVSPAEANQSYCEFLERWTDLIHGKPPFSVISVYWPGDRPNSISSILHFMADIGIATDCGSELAQYLQANMAAGQRLHIIAHSLGNRIAIDMLQKLTLGPKQIDVGNYILMASAVPMDRVDRGAKLQAGASFPNHSRVLFSTHDHVLHFAFPPGEFLSGDDLHAIATGRFGGPIATYGDTKQFDYCHSQYWHEDASVAAAAGVFGTATANTISTTSVDTNILPPQNAFATNTTPTNTVGGATSCIPSTPFKCGFF